VEEFRHWIQKTKACVELSQETFKKKQGGREELLQVYQQQKEEQKF